MGGATREFYIEVLEEALGIIEPADADHLVIGGVESLAVPDPVLPRLVAQAGAARPGRAQGDRRPDA